MSPKTTPALKSELLHDDMKVGLFGGSFDPVHKGHIHVAETALKRLGLDRIWWLVSPQNPLKAHPPGDYARRMSAIHQSAYQPRMVVSDIETRLGINRTSELVSHLKERHQRVKFVWIMGADSLAGFHHWQNWQAIVATLPIAIVARPKDPVRARLSRFARQYAPFRLDESRAHHLANCAPPCWTYLTEPLHEDSSSALRAHLHCPFS